MSFDSEYYYVYLISKIMILFVGMAGYDPKKGRPRLSTWMENVTKQTSPYYQEAHKFLNYLADKAKEKTSQTTNKL